MSSGERLWWGAGVAGSLLVGLLAGIWIGGEIEQDVIIEIVTKADLTADCRQQLERAMDAVIKAWEGPAAISE
jgi:hypothetical protein